jgi:hypothetical protein
MSVTGWSVFLIGALLSGVSGRGAIIDAVNGSTAAVAVVVADGCAGLLLLQLATVATATRITDAYGTRLMTLYSLLISLLWLLLLLLFFFSSFCFFSFFFRALADEGFSLCEVRAPSQFLKINYSFLAE